jgi:predicted PurR-regulated permease PerM
MMFSDSQKWLMLAATVALAGLLYALSPVLSPFFAAALLAYLCNPLVLRLQKFKLSRALAVVVVFVLLSIVVVLLLVLLIPMLEQQITYLIKNFPAYLDVVQQRWLPAIAQQFNLDPAMFDLAHLRQALMDQLAQSGGLAMQLVSSITQSGLMLFVWLGNLVLIPVVMFYLLRDWNDLIARIDELLPRRYQPLVEKLARESDDVLAAFLRGQFMVMLALALIYSVGLWLIGLKLGLLIGVISGLVSFVPYLGFIVGIVAAGIAMLLQSHDVLQLIPVIIVFGVGQLAEGMVLTPWLVGDRIGLHPVAVIFAVLAGGQLFGFVGVLLALPAAAVIAVVLRHAHERYLSSSLYGPAE